MAEDAEKKEGSEKEEGEGEGGEKTKKKKSSLLPTLIGGVALVVIGPLVGFFAGQLLSKGSAKTTQTEASAHGEGGEAKAESKDAHGSSGGGHGSSRGSSGGHGSSSGGAHGSGGEAKGGGADINQVPISDIFVNIRETKGTRVLKVVPCLVISSPRFGTIINENMHQVRDIIAEAARSATMDQLDGDHGRDDLKMAIRDSINSAFKDRMAGAVTEVFFSEFLIQ